MTATASPTPLATPNPLTTRQSTAPAGTQTTGSKENPLQARTGSHTVTFTSQPDTQGMPASQTIPDGKTAVPPQPTPTDNVALPLRQTGTGTWQATTTVHDPGPVPAQVRWTLAGQPQPDDTTNTYTYRHTDTTCPQPPILHLSKRPHKEGSHPPAIWRRPTQHPNTGPPPPNTNITN